MGAWEEYVRPQRIEDALAALEAAGGAGRVVAGGTDLLLDVQQGRTPAPRTLVDLASIPELTRITIAADQATIGAAATHHAILSHPILQARATALVEACGLIGGPQVRRVATLGGNVAHALPAGDGTIALLALDAQADLASPHGTRSAPLSELFAGPGETTFDRSREFLTAFRFRLTGAGEASAFARVMRPQGVAIAILNMGCWARLDEEGRFEAVRIALGPAGPIPRRAHQTEQALHGRLVSEIDWDRLEVTLLKEASFRTSPHRATAEYRALLAPIVLRRAVATAIRRVQPEGSSA